MLSVLTLAQANELLAQTIAGVPLEKEEVPLKEAAFRILYEEIRSGETVPGFSRSTVDGYAVRAQDTFGCSASIPALLTLSGRVSMGELPGLSLSPGECAYVPTGGALPRHGDAVVMLEYAEELGNLVALEKSAAPGQGVIFAGDDVKAGQRVLSKGTRLTGREIGALAALGITRVPVVKRPRVTVLSTGDELVAPEEKPGPGQIRDVNGPMLAAMCREMGAVVACPPIVRDQEALLHRALKAAEADSDLILLSGGSSVGVRDEAAKVIASLGELLFHGLAVKPGKPAMGGRIGSKPVIGLPGHPVAACMLCRLMVFPLLAGMQGIEIRDMMVQAVLAVNLPSNHGREEYIPVRLEGGTAVPVMGKSGLIMTLADTDGYLRIPKDAEGLSGGDPVNVYRWETMEAK